MRDSAQSQRDLPDACQREVPADATCTICDAAQWLTRNTGPVILCTHTKPDGDAFGAVTALATALRACGVEAMGWFVPPVAPALMKLAGSGDTLHFEPATRWPQACSYVVLDTASWSQLGPQRPLLEPHLEQTLVIDHHLSGDIPARRMLVDTRSASCCEMVSQVIDKMDPGRRFVTGDAARIVDEALFVGLASDTGWFRFSNTTPSTHVLAARLMARGVDHAMLYQILEQQERPERLKLMARALQSMRLLGDGRAAIMVLGADDFRETGATYDETERLIDLPQRIATVGLVALLTEQQTNGTPEVRLSLRSRHAADAVDVARLAKNFGGGGHVRASGATLAMPMEQAIAVVQAAFEQALRQGRATREKGTSGLLAGADERVVDGGG